MFLAAEHIGKRDKENSLVPCLMGSSMAIGALKRGESTSPESTWRTTVRVTWNLPYLERNLTGIDCLVVTFAHWEEGLILRQGNPKKIRSVSDLARPAVKIVNREMGGRVAFSIGSLKLAAFKPIASRDYGDEVSSHLEVASRVRAGWRMQASACGLGHYLRSRFRSAAARALRSGHSQGALRNPAGLKIFLDTDCQQAI